MQNILMGDGVAEVDDVHIRREAKHDAFHHRRVSVSIGEIGQQSGNFHFRTDFNKLCRYKRIRKEPDRKREYAKIGIMKTPPVCDYEGSDYQEKFWGAGGRAYEDAAEALALKKLLPKSGKHLLELGAGAGRNTLRYAGFERVTLLDYSTTQLAQAIEKLGEGPGYRYIAADIYRLPFAPSTFDAATMIRTLHHFAQPQLALEQVRGCLTGGACFILEFANKRNIKSVLRYAAGKQKWNPFSREAVEFVKLNFDLHPAAVKALLEGERL